MPLSDHLTTSQIDQAVLSLKPGEALLCKDGNVVKYSRPKVKPPKKKTKRGRRRRGRDYETDQG